MLQRIHELMQDKTDFAFETTLSTRSYVSLIKTAKALGYKITLLFFWLHSPVLAKDRVGDRVSKGGHNIPLEIIERRYYRGLFNLINLYIQICDNWIVVDNRGITPELVAQGTQNDEKMILNAYIWDTILVQSKQNAKQ